MVNQMKANPRTFGKQKSSSQPLKFLSYAFLVLIVIFLYYVIGSSLHSSIDSDSHTLVSWVEMNSTTPNSKTKTFISQLRDSVNFLPGIDLSSSSSSSSDESETWVFFNQKGEAIENNDNSARKTFFSKLRDSVNFLPRIDLSSSISSSSLPASRQQDKGKHELKALITKLQNSVTFLPLKDLRFKKTAMEGHTWFMSSLNDTYEENEAEYLYFPSENSNGRLLCIKATTRVDGMNNSYALAWPESLPKSAKFLKGLSFISSTYYDYVNLWHGLSAFAPFVGWSMKHRCVKPTRWLFFVQGSPQKTTGSWLQKVMEGNFGDISIESFQEAGDVPYCFEKALVMRHDLGHMGLNRKHEVYQQIRCNARSFCAIKPEGKGRDFNENGVPNIRLTLLMRKGSRSFKDPQAVTEIFRKECAKVEGCILEVSQSEDLSFCDQVKVLTYTDILASTHGAQMTNMIFMDQNSTVMECFPKGWLEFAGIGQYAHHWLAAQSGMKHPDAYWETLDKIECPRPKDASSCFNFYKNGQVGHNETFFAEWIRSVLKDVKYNKEKQDANNFAVCTCQ
ncbi:hypothetical protein Droror1_Dr00011291 [Drosera rotundifolia]